MMKPATMFGCAAFLLMAAGCTTPGVKVSEKFGYDPVDATANVQAALDSGETHLILDRQAGDWNVRPLFLKRRSDLTVDFEDGVRLVAKRGAYHAQGDHLLTMTCCTNITLRGTSPERCGLKMWYDDYYNRDKKKKNAHGYVWSEWRHGISLLSCGRVTLENVSSNESGGDGLYISTFGGNGASCSDITVRNCIFDRNNRQGISVIGARGLTIEDTILSNTGGTAPAAGIDFEPNKPHEAITGVTMRRCRAINNEGSGFFAWLGQLDETSLPFDGVFEDCIAVSNRECSFSFSTGSSATGIYDYDRIEVRRCRFESAGEHGFRVSSHPHAQGAVVVRDTVISDNCRLKTNLTDIAIEVTGHGTRPPNTVTFDNVTVIRPQPGRIISSTKRQIPFTGRPTVFSGTLRGVVAGREEKFVFDADWNAANHPYRLPTSKALPRVAATLDNVTVVDSRPGELLELKNPLFYRDRKRRVVFYADRAKSVRFKLQQTTVGSRTFNATKMRVFRFGEKKPVSAKGVPVPTNPNGGLVTLDVPAKGFYELDLQAGGNGIAILATDVPLAYDVRKGHVNFIAPSGGPAGRFRKVPGELFFYVPAGTAFGLLHAGEGPEAVGLDIIDPAGKTVRHEPVLADINELDVTPAAGGLWSVRTFPPEQGCFEDFDLSLAGIPGWFFATRERYWK